MRMAHWPARWKQRGRKIYYRPRDDERDKYDGKHWYPLGSNEPEAFATWFRMQTGAVVPRSIREAIGIYKASDRYANLADKTRREYDRALTNIDAVFGHMRPQDVIPADVYRWMSTLAPVTANRHRSVMLNVMKTCVKHGAIDRNPVREVEPNPEEERERYVTDEELEQFMAKCCTPFLRAYLGLKLVTGLRQGQLLALRVSDWNPEGIPPGDDPEAPLGTLLAPGRKRGRDNVYWGEGLKEAVQAALAVRRKVVSHQWLYSTRRGQRYTGDGFRSLWSYAMWKWTTQEGGPKGEHFTEHDVRAKVGSDSEDVPAAQARLQHQSASTTKRTYRRKPATVQVLKR